MSDLIAPMPNGVIPGSGFWNDWIEKLRSIVNGLLTQINWSSLTGTPTTLAGYGITDPVELTTHKDAVSGYAGLDANSRVTKGVKTTDDLIVDNVLKGLVLKSPNGHYWQINMNNAGAPVFTDLGTTSP